MTVSLHTDYTLRKPCPCRGSKGLPCMRKSHLRPLIGVTVAASVVFAMGGVPTGAAPGAEELATNYQVSNVRTVEQRTKLAKSGAAIDSIEEHGIVVITATAREAKNLKAQG